jgi:uncharacterized protein involved in exopolysaccharide biosynthesis
VSEQVLPSNPASRPYNAQDVLAMGSRHKGLMITTFALVFLGASLVAFFSPPSYEAHTKLLVKRERVDPVVTPGQETRVMASDDVTEEELNSEVELLESDDVLRQVVVACGLEKVRHGPIWVFLNAGKTDDEEKETATATKHLRNDLQIEALRRSNIISIRYTSHNPRLAAFVLKNLNEVYIQKDVELHRPQGQYKFFEQEADLYKKQLDQAEQQLQDFATQGGVAPVLERDNALQKLAEFRASLQATRADMAATTEKIRDLEQQASSLPARITTQQRDSSQLLEQLKSTLMNLELKRTELLTKFQPDYPLVKEADHQIADTKSAIATEESKPLQEQTTDQNPTYQYVTTELAKAKADLSALQAREAATQATVGMYRGMTETLEKKGILQQDLLRSQKADEENYLLYLHKQEEARISDALDRQRILNVVVAEEPLVPVLPVGSPWIIVGMGLILGVVAGTGLALVVELLHPAPRASFVLVESPQGGLNRDVRHGANGHGNGNGSHADVMKDPVVIKKDVALHNQRTATQ